jgi:hypothetical protein
MEQVVKAGEVLNDETRRRLKIPYFLVAGSVLL